MPDILHILKVKDDEGVWHDIPALKGDKGNKGDKGDKGNKGDKGDKGDTGAVPDFSIGTVTTGAAGTDASATITGTDEAPVLNLTIPRGNTGEISEAQFNPVRNAVSKNGTYIIAPGTGDSSAILNYISGMNANTASGDYSFAEGYRTAAEGNSSHAEGYGTVAKQFGDHSEGCQTEADSKVGGGYVSGAHAEGIYTKANNTAAHAEGNSTTASGENSHAEGKNTVASKKSQHVFGEYNIAETGYGFSRGTYVEIVGNGTSNNAKSNARTLDWSGNEVLAGNLTAAGGSLTLGQTTLTENQLASLLALLGA